MVLKNFEIAGTGNFEMNEEIYRRRGNSFGSWRAP
jgi:hypothetical protein